MPIKKWRCLRFSPNPGITQYGDNHKAAFALHETLMETGGMVKTY